MKKWIIYGVLLCSLAFNIIFITRACENRKKFPPMGPPKMKKHKRESLRNFLDGKKNNLRKVMRESNSSKDRLICKFLEEDISKEDMDMLKDSLIKITVDREEKFIEYLIEYKTQEKGKKRSEK